MDTRFFVTLTMVGLTFFISPRYALAAEIKVGTSWKISVISSVRDDAHKHGRNQRVRSQSTLEIIELTTFGYKMRWADQSLEAIGDRAAEVNEKIRQLLPFTVDFQADLHWEPQAIDDREAAIERQIELATLVAPEVADHTDALRELLMRTSEQDLAYQILKNLTLISSCVGLSLEDVYPISADNLRVLNGAKVIIREEIEKKYDDPDDDIVAIEMTERFDPASLKDFIANSMNSVAEAPGFEGVDMQSLIIEVSKLDLEYERRLECDISRSRNLPVTVEFHDRTLSTNGTRRVYSEITIEPVN